MPLYLIKRCPGWELILDCCCEIFDCPIEITLLVFFTPALKWLIAAEGVCAATLALITILVNINKTTVVTVVWVRLLIILNSFRRVNAASGSSATFALG
jgi:hypothetical protein